MISLEETTTWPYRRWRLGSTSWDHSVVLHAPTVARFSDGRKIDVAFCSYRICLLSPDAKIDKDCRPCLVCLRELKRLEILGPYDEVDHEGRLDTRDGPRSVRQACALCGERRMPGKISGWLCRPCERDEFRRITDTHNRRQALREARKILTDSQQSDAPTSG